MDVKERLTYIQNQLEQNSKYYEKMKTGEKYYKQENEEIMNRAKQMGMETQKGHFITVEDPYRANHKMASGFARTHIMQKVSYLINENLSFSSDEDDIKELFPDVIKDIKKLSKKVSYQIWGAWQFFIEDEKLKKKLIPGNELLPIFEGNAKEKVIAVVRKYKKNGIKYIEFYDSQVEIKWEKKKDKYKLLYNRNHLFNKKKIGVNEEVIDQKGESWGRPPFAFLFNNDDFLTDIDPIKAGIDVYDITKSDFANNIDDFQEIYRTLKNFSGQDLNEFNAMLKKVKIVPIPEDGEMQTHQAEVPVEARKALLQIVRRDIFDDGMAVDLREISAGNVTQLQISSMYELLNMKCSDFAIELGDFWNQVLYFVNKFYEFRKINKIINNELQFDKKLLINKKEKAEIDKQEVETATALLGILDDQTLSEVLANIDFIAEKINITPEKLIERLKKQREGFNIDENVGG